MFEELLQLIEPLKANKYLFASIVFIAFYVLSQILVYIIENVILKLTSKTKTKLDDKLVQKVNKPLSILLICTGLRIGSATLNLSESITNYTNKIFTSITTALIVYIVVAFINTSLQIWGEIFAKKTKSHLDDNLVNLGVKFANILGIVVGTLSILSVWGIEIAPFLASLGIAGIAVAMGLQKSLANIFGGISLILDRTVKVGDVVSLDETTVGTILDVGLRSTKLKTFDNEVIIIPNGELENMKVQNIVQPDPTARVVIPFSVAYGCNIDKVKKIVVKEINKIEGILTDEDHAPSVKFIEMGDSALIMKAFFWMESYSQRFRAKDEANTLIYNALNKNKIEIPFPQMDVHLKK